jgi:NTE family protein
VLALSGGGAAGLAHIGVLQVLGEEGLAVRAVVGTSIGAEIGGFFASGMPPDDLAALATGFDWKKVLQLFLPDLPAGGLISGIRIVDFLNSWIGNQQIEDLAVGFAAVAADLETGEQVVLDRGDLVEAVRAAISMPGIMAPHRYRGRWLVDGGVVNPVPFDVARARFGGPVVAVAVHAGARIRAPAVALPAPSPQWPRHVRQLLGQPWMTRAPVLRDWLHAQVQRAEQRGPRTRAAWTARGVLDRALDITQSEIVKLRAAASPPDIMLAPAIADIGLLEFYRARDAIEAGRRVARDALPRLRALR